MKVPNARTLLRITLFLFLLLFLSGRLGLVLHEFLGHGLAAGLCGGKIEEFRLSVFGGGWVSYSLETIMPAGQTIISLAGIGVEFLAGILLLAAADYSGKEHLHGRLMTAFAILLVVHAFYYLTISFYYGNGDGYIIYHVLREYREILLPILFAVSLLSAFGLAAANAGYFMNMVLPEKESPSPTPLLVCSLAAVSLHAVLTFGEAALIKDPRMEQIMRPAYKIKMEKTYEKRMARYKQRNNRPLQKKEKKNIRKELEREMKPFPVEFPFVAALLAALSFGCIFRIRTPGKTVEMGGRDELRLLAVLCMISLAGILVLSTAL